MSDPYTTQGVGRMFPGSLGGRSRAASPVSPVQRQKFVYAKAVHLVCTSLLAFDDSTGATSYTTGSVSPAAGALILATVATTSVSGLPTRTLTGCGLTWVELATANTSNAQMTLWYGSGTPSGGALTAGFSGFQTGCSILVDQITGLDVVSTAGQSITPVLNGSTSTLTVTLAPTPFRAGDGSYGTFLSGGHFSHGGPLSPGAGFSAVSSASSRTAQAAMSEFTATYDSSVDATSSATAPMIGIALDVFAPAP